MNHAMKTWGKMKVDEDQCSQVIRKRGRPANLLASWQQIIRQGPIEPLDCARLNCADWFLRSHGYLKNLSCPEIGYQSGLTMAMESHIGEQVRQLKKTPLGKFFKTSAANQMDLPDLRLSSSQMERAIELSRALLRITRRDPYFVRSAVLGYCEAVSDRRRIRLTDLRVAEYGKILIRLVKRLKLPSIEARLIGYQVQNEKGDLSKWLEMIKPGRDTPLEFILAENQSSRAECGHIGIDIRNTESQRSSAAFFSVMVTAATTEIWRCVWIRKRALQSSDTQASFRFPLASQRLR